MNKIISVIQICTCFLLIILQTGYVVGQEVESIIVDKYNSYRYQHSEELAILSIDKKIYFNGGILFFNLAILDQYYAPSQLSKIAYIELIGDDGDWHKKYVFKLNKGILNSHIDIPLDIPTGNYQLVAYTRFMRNSDLDKSSHRVPIYIQNFNEPTERVVRDVSFNSDKVFSIDSAGYQINITERSEDFYLEILSNSVSKEKLYLISEGYGILQFIARLKMRKNRIEMSIGKDQMVGNFQRLILIDEELNLKSIKSFYVSEDLNLTPRWEFSEENFNFSVDNNLLSAISISKEGFGQNRLSFFRRLYQHYYNIPEDVNLNRLSFEELISNQSLSSYSMFSMGRWQRILAYNGSEKNYEYLPEDNVQLRGSIKSADTITNSILATHFRDNHVDLYTPIDESGNFAVDLLIPVGNDIVYSMIYNENGRDISGRCNIKLEENLLMTYNSNVDYLSKELTDSIIQEKKHFGYIISTFGTSQEKRQHFWREFKLDESYHTKDYRGLVGLEEFIREAIPTVSFFTYNGRKTVKVYSPEFGSEFADPPAIIVNDAFVDDSSALYRMSLDSIKAVHVLNKVETLNGVGKIFKNGVIIIETHKRHSITSSLRSKYSLPFTSLSIGKPTNEIAVNFSNVKGFGIGSGNSFQLPLLDSRSGLYDFTMQSLTSDGRFQFRTGKFEIKN